jgi:putative FmdB family regulatory protein
MPTYEFECLRCERPGEYVAPMSESDNPPECSECGNATRRVILTPPKGYVDFPAASGCEYISPVSGKRIGSKRERIEDLKRTNSRPYEGREQEEKEAKRYRDHVEKKGDEAILETVKEVFQQLPPSKRQELES